MMAVVAVVFFVTSFVAAAVSSQSAGRAPTNQGTLASDCIVVHSADGRTLGECSFSAP